MQAKKASPRVSWACNLARRAGDGSGVGQRAAGVVLAGCLERQALLNLQPLHQD